MSNWNPDDAEKERLATKFFTDLLKKPGSEKALPYEYKRLNMEHEQTAWIVEYHKESAPTQYLGWDTIESCSGPHWVKTVDEALKFADRASAGKVCEEACFDRDIRVCEHIWLDK